MKAVVIDAKELFVDHFIFPALKADALYESQYPSAYEIAGKLISYAVKKGKVLSELSFADYSSFSPLFGEDVSMEREGKSGGKETRPFLPLYAGCADIWYTG